MMDLSQHFAPESSNFFGCPCNVKSWLSHSHLAASPIYSTDPAPWGGIPGPCPPTDCLCSPNENCAPPKRGLCPEEINRFRALERKCRPKLVLFVDLKLEKPLENSISAGKFLEISVKTFFFWRSPVFARKKHLKFGFRPEIPFKFLHLTLFLWSR